MNIFKWLFSRKYRVFKKKIRDVETSIWEYEFKIAKSRQVREGIRQDRDRAMETAKRIETVLKTADQDKGIDVKQCEADRAKALDNAKRFEAQIKMVDDQINGVTPSEENPMGQQGILEIIASLSELSKMYQSYLSQI